MEDSLVISKSELSKIRADALSNISNAKKSKKEILHEMSNERASKWGNTLTAQREAKQRAKILKREAEEAELRKIDDQEEAIRNEHRLAMREAAKKAKQEQSDEIRQFKSKLMMADIVHQREQQLKIKNYQTMMEKELDKTYLQQTLHTMKQFDDKENEKKKIIKQKQQETKQIIATQLIEVDARKQKEKLETAAEAKYLISVAKDEERKAIEREEKRVSHIKKIQSEQAMWLKQQMKQKKENNEKRKHEDAAIAKYAAEKQRVEQIRKEKEKQRHDEKQRIRQKLIDSQTKHLQNLKLNEDDRVAKQVMESAAKKDEFEKKKADAQMKLLSECLAQCELQQNKKKEQKAKCLKEDRERLAIIKQDVKQFEKEEANNLQIRKQDAIKVQKLLKTEAAHQKQITKKYEDEKKEISLWAKQKIK